MLAVQFELEKSRGLAAAEEASMETLYVIHICLRGVGCCGTRSATQDVCREGCSAPSDASSVTSEATDCYRSMNWTDGERSALVHACV